MAAKILLAGTTRTVSGATINALRDSGHVFVKLVRDRPREPQPLAKAR
jgi:hypothetical protein